MTCELLTENLFIIALTIVFGTHGGHAYDPSVDNCTYHSSDGSTSDPHVSDLLNKFGRDSAVRFCPAIGDNGEDRHYVLTPISQQGRIHFYDETQTFLVENAGAMVWDHFPPERLRERLGDRYIKVMYMCAMGLSCERHNSKGFVATKGLSPYLFRRLQDAWTDATKHESAFYDLVKDALSGDATEDAAFKSARNFIFAQRPNAVRILSAQFSPSFRAGYSESGRAITVPPHFEFSFADAGSKRWLFHYEYRDHGIRILYFGETIP